MASDQGGQGRRIQQPRVCLTQGPARQPLCPHGQPQPLPLRGLLKGAPLLNKTSICMVCLSFEQSVLKKQKTKKNRKTKKFVGVGGREGWFIRKNCIVGIFVLFLYLLGIRTPGPSNMIAGMECGTAV